MLNHYPSEQYITVLLSHISLSEAYGKDYQDLGPEKQYWHICQQQDPDKAHFWIYRDEDYNLVQGKCNPTSKKKLIDVQDDFKPLPDGFSASSIPQLMYKVEQSSCSKREADWYAKEKGAKILRGLGGRSFMVIKEGEPLSPYQPLTKYHKTYIRKVLTKA